MNNKMTYRAIELKGTGRLDQLHKVVLPRNLIPSMDAVLDANPGIGSITPWSNNVSASSRRAA